jgi:adenylate kinase
MKATIIAAIVLAFSVNQAFAVSREVKIACRADYFAHCSMHAVGSQGLRKCMRDVGPNLSRPCIVALIGAGEVGGTKAKAFASVAKKKVYASKAIAKAQYAQKPTTKKYASSKVAKKKYAKTTGKKRYVQKPAKKRYVEKPTKKEYIKYAARND